MHYARKSLRAAEGGEASGVAKAMEEGSGGCCDRILPRATTCQRRMVSSRATDSGDRISMTSENPYEAPSTKNAGSVSATPQRWYHLRLSTVLILMSIVGWTLTCRPLFEVTTFSVHTGDPAMPRSPLHSPVSFLENTTISFNPLLIWPALALAAFLLWKLGMALASRRKRSSISTQT